MSQIPHLTTTCFTDEVNFGQQWHGFQNEDMQDLTFNDNIFDLVLHSEVLEHVINFPKAFDETIRILKSGGITIFTVPMQLRNSKSFERFEFSNTGELVFTKGKIWHGWAGGPFSLIPKRSDYLELHSFDADFQDYLNLTHCKIKILKQSGWESGADWVFIATKN
jgi:SAM-dependent methyltransferase